MAQSGKRSEPTPAPARSRRGRRLTWVLLGLLVALLAAYSSGWLGYGWARLKAKVLPRDEALLGFVPDSATALFVVDPHLLDLAALGPDMPGAPIRQSIGHARDEVKKATGIDIAYDVDKIVAAPGLIVARGRFDEPKVRDKLTAHRYAAAELKGTRYMVRPGEDALAIVDDVLLYADEPVIKSIIEARADGHTLDKDDKVTDRLKRIGWDHGVVFSLRLADDTPSLRALIQGGNAPRAVTVAITTKNGLDVSAIVDAASVASAQALAKLLDEKRQTADALRGWAPDDSLLNAIADSAPLAEAAKHASIRMEGSSVLIGAHLDTSAIGGLLKAVVDRAGPLLRAPDH